MPGRGRNRRSAVSPRRPPIFTNGITTDERDELIRLVSAITERMMTDLAKAFHSPPSTPLDNTTSDNISFAKENQPPAAAQVAFQSHFEPMLPVPEAYAKTHEIVEKEEEEVTAHHGELKKEALAFYGKWRASILQRLQDIAIKEPAPAAWSTRGGASAGRGPRGDGSVRGGSTVRGARGGGRGSLSSLSIRTGQSFEVIAETEAEPDLILRIPQTPTMLSTLPVEKRKLLLHAMLLLLLGLEVYVSYSRILLINLAASLRMSLRVLQTDEVRMSRSLSSLLVELKAEQDAKEKADQPRATRRSKAATGAERAVPAVLAAPLASSGVGTVLGDLGLGSAAAAGLLGTMGENPLVIGSMFGMYAARQTAKTMESYARDVSDLALMPLHGEYRGEYTNAKQILPMDRRLHMVLALSGWLTDNDDATSSWRCLGDQSEAYALRWEVQNLVSMGIALETVVKSDAWRIAKKEIVARTIFTSLTQGTWPASLHKISKLIDNPWSLGMVRAEKAGFFLADALMRKVQGERPISLIGYSLAARVIYCCLLTLAERRQFGLVDSVVLIGTPAPSETRVWVALKSVVAGRLVNVYSESDYILGFLYRTSSIQFGVAGLQPIQGADGVENYDVSNVISGHLRYRYMVANILKNIGWEDLDLEQVVEDEKRLAEVDKKYEKEIPKKPTWIDMDKEVSQLEAEVKTKNKKSKWGSQKRKKGSKGKA